ncbi:AI-2E family transporter [Phenylobacterium sp.]|uniref:AI-2E family transporter n=1 Tax=Phenylobacterium sp. TaxID=1871053 RepID=UPI0035AEEDFF
MPRSPGPLSRAAEAAGEARARLWERSDLSFLQKALIAAALLGIAALVVRLADVLLLAFGSVLVAVLLHAMSAPLMRRTRLGRRSALTLAVLVLTAALALTLWLFGHEASVQLAALAQLVPVAWAGLEQRLTGSPLGGYVLDNLERLAHADGLLISVGPQLVRQLTGAAAAGVIVFFAGLYLAFHPKTYIGGLLRLVPVAARPRAAEIVSSCGLALDRWLVGQLVSMVLVGVTTGVGLWLAGVPSPLALGVLAGLGQFIPVVGPAAAMAPGLLIALAQAPETFVWAAVVYVAAMQAEANVITPLLLRQMVELPMAVTLFAVLAMGVLLGPLGVLFATPLAVVAYVLVRMIYVEGVLGDPIAPGPAEASP